MEKSRLLVYRTLVCQASSYRPAIASSDFLNETRRRDARLQSRSFARSKKDVRAFDGAGTLYRVKFRVLESCFENHLLC